MLPSVSIIIPAYNSEKNIAGLIESLLNLDYPKDLFEIIIIDNNSEDRTKEIVKKYPVRLLEESGIQSSYAARNKGIEYAKGDIIAFTDSDCIVTPQWIKEGVRSMLSESADLAGGKVEFIYSKRNAAEFYDSISNMHNESCIREKNIAKTANLFVRASVFRKIGMFSGWAKSGGDVQWTSRATSEGFLLVYTPEAVVKHPARSYNALVKKQFNVGRGMACIWINERQFFPTFISTIIKIVFPLRLSNIKNRVYNRGTEEMKKKVLGIWCVAYISNIAGRLGILSMAYRGILKKYVKLKNYSFLSVSICAGLACLVSFFWLRLCRAVLISASFARLS